ncbi:hypothetical protein PG996_005903 [Apiospora saccharicola]|uniref:Uncharacterized protein n=1 Tax=Apiospora saccharicola TaxID=335842 RepID=A0ABR1VMU1_9PEZI
MKGHSYYPIIFALGLASFAQVCRDARVQCTTFWRSTRSSRSFGTTRGVPNAGFLEELLKKLGGGNGQEQAQKETVTKTMKQTITVGAAPTEAAGKNGTNNAAAGGVKTVIQTITSGAAPPVQAPAAQTVTVTVTAAANDKTVTQMMTMTQVQTITMVQMIACGTTQGNPVPASQASAIASSAANAASSNLAKQPPPAATTPATSAPAASSSAAAPPPPPASSAAPPAASTTSATQKSSTTPLAAQPAPPTTTAAAPKPPTTAQPAQAASSLVLPVAGGAAVAAPALSTMDPAGLQGVNNMPINLSGLTLNSNLNLGAIAAQKTPAAFNVGAAAAPAAAKPTTTGAAEPFKLVLSG